MSFLRLGLSWLQQCASKACHRLLAWRPIPLRQLEPCIPSNGTCQRRQQPWFTSVDLPRNHATVHCRLSHDRLRRHVSGSQRAARWRVNRLSERTRHLVPTV